VPKDEWFKETGKVPKGVSQDKGRSQTHAQSKESDDDESDADELTDDDSLVGSSRSTRRNRPQEWEVQA
jgi:hypothetical protein